MWKLLLNTNNQNSTNVDQNDKEIDALTEVIEDWYIKEYWVKNDTNK